MALPICMDSNPDRILLLGAGELFGGVERHILDLLGALAKRGAEPLLALFHDAELAAQARTQGFESRILPSGRGATFAAAAALARLLEQERIRVVHVHGYKAMVVCALARRYWTVPVLKTEHGLPEGTSGWGAGALRSRAYAVLDSLATRASRACVCYVTHEIESHCRARHAGLQTRVIPNGIASLDRGRLPRPSELGIGVFNLVVVGRLSPVKGQAGSIQALAALRPDLRIDLHLLGDGACAEALRNQVALRGLGDRVHFHGFRRDAYAFIAHSDALLMPSLHEGLPYTLLEAMALGTPVIASRVGGLAETLRDGETALLVEPSDIGALSHAIARLYDDPGLRRGLAARARSLQQQQYTVDRMVEQYLEIYRRLSDLSPGGARLSRSATKTQIQ